MSSLIPRPLGLIEQESGKNGGEVQETRLGYVWVRHLPFTGAMSATVGPVLIARI